MSRARVGRSLVAVVAAAVVIAASAPAGASEVGGGVVTFDLDATVPVLPCTATECDGTLAGSSSGALAGVHGTNDWELVYKDATLTGTFKYKEDRLLHGEGHGTITITPGSIVHGRYGSYAIDDFTLTASFSYSRDVSFVLAPITGKANLVIDTAGGPDDVQVITNHDFAGTGTIVPDLPDYCSSPLRVVGSVVIAPYSV